MLDADLLRTLETLGIDGGRLLVAVSGGRDSMVLFDLLRRVADSRALELVVGHVNHGLRGEESDGDEALVRRIAAAAGVDCHVRRVSLESELAAPNSRTRPTLEEAARNRRRAALEELARETGCRFIATAHHAGDQAETVLLRLLRGTGPDGLAAMAPIDRDGRWLRPLLGAMPEDVEEWAREARVEWREDSTNQDRRFARNRLRHDWIPELAATFNPQLLRTLNNLAEAERRDLEWIEDLVRIAAEERIEIGPSGIRMAIDGWAELPEALARRLARHAMVEAGLARDVTRVHLARVLAFLRRGRAAGRDRRIELPGGIVLRRVDDAFVLEAEAGRNEIESRSNARVHGRD